MNDGLGNEESAMTNETEQTSPHVSGLTSAAFRPSSGAKDLSKADGTYAMVVVADEFMEPQEFAATVSWES